MIGINENEQVREGARHFLTICVANIIRNYLIIWTACGNSSYFVRAIASMASEDEDQ